MAKLTGFIFQDGYLEPLAKLSDQELGRLVRALAKYHMTGEEQEQGKGVLAADYIHEPGSGIIAAFIFVVSLSANSNFQTITLIY